MNIARDGVKKQDMYDVLDGICKNCEGRARCPNDWCNEVLYAIRDLIKKVDEWSSMLNDISEGEEDDFSGEKADMVLDEIRDFGKERK